MNSEALAPDISDDVLPSNAEVVQFVRRSDSCLSAMIATSLAAYHGRDALGWRPTRNGILSDRFELMSYDELERRVWAVASALKNDPDIAMKTGDPVAIMAFANVDFVTLNFALGLNGMIIAPLQTTAGMEALTGLCEDLKAPCLATSLEHLDAVVTLASASPETRCILVFDHDGLDSAAMSAIDAARTRLAAEKPSCVVIPFSEAISRGEALPRIDPYVPDDIEDTLALIYYTSGSTGTPKGVMYSEKLVKSAWAMAGEASQTVLHYQPLNHSFGMSFIATVTAGGGTTYFTAKSDLSMLLEDMKIVRPTMMAWVPRICELLYLRYHSDYGDLIKTNEEEALRRFKNEVLGGRMRNALGGSAPTSDELQIFVEKVNGRKLYNGYGCTEAGGVIWVDNVVQRPPVIDYKLVDVPHLGYFTTDKPYPRGELAIKSQTMFRGYFARPDLTARAFDEDGFYLTGDIMEERGQDRLFYLDRTNNVMKLSQGEFVPVSLLESLYANDPEIRQVYLYGNSARSFLLGVVVPNFDVLPQGLSDKEIKARFLASMNRIATDHERHTYEIPRDIVIEHEPFSADNGLLAGIGKYMRPAFKARYGDMLEQLYKDIASRQDSEYQDLRENGKNGPVLDTVVRAAAAVLGIEVVAPDESESFAHLGGDSLAALSYSILLEDIYGFPVDVGMIMHPAGSFRQLAGNIDDIRSFKRVDPFSLVHGGDAAVLQASDLTVDKLVDPAILSSAPALSLPASAEPKTVLLTGANGFLGRFLCLEWLKRLEKNNGRLICIGRGADDEGAKARLLEVFEGGDGAFARDLHRLAGDGRLTVLAGDLSAPHLGLDDTQWHDLAADVDLIVHPAALVNHKLPYRQLFGPNVIGTATLIELALTSKMKRFSHVSTIAAIGHDGKIAAEDDDLAQVIPQWRTSEAYADGYGASKWAAEILLADAHKRFGLPICVFRSNMIMAPASYSGQLNIPDVFTRQMLSLALTGVAPKSFYSGNSATAHYEGLPADFIAAAIVAIGEAKRAGYHNFHVLNPNDDGISFDTFTDWLADFGYSIDRIDDYDDWLTRFTTAMRALPEERRHASLLPLMDAFSKPMRATAGASVPADRFIEAVAETCHETDGKIPQLSPHIIRRYVDDLKDAGLLE